MTVRRPQLNLGMMRGIEEPVRRLLQNFSERVLRELNFIRDEQDLWIGHEIRMHSGPMSSDGKWAVLNGVKSSVWHICDGTAVNGITTPNLTSPLRFVRFSTAAGATGGADTMAHTHSTPNHYHETPIGFSGGTMYLYRDGSNFPGYGSDVPSVSQYNGAHGFSAASGAARLARTNNTGGGTTGAASNDENRPAYYELIPVMRVA